MDFGYSITLKVTHHRLATDEWRKVLGLRPGRSWVVGEPRTTPIGTPLSESAGIYKESYCYFNMSDGLGWYDFERALRATTRRIARHAGLVRRWRNGGGTLSYHVFLHGKNAMGVNLAPDLLVEIGRLGITLGIEALATRQHGSTARARARKRARRAGAAPEQKSKY